MRSRSRVWRRGGRRVAVVGFGAARVARVALVALVALVTGAAGCKRAPPQGADNEGAEAEAGAEAGAGAGASGAGASLAPAPSEDAVPQARRPVLRWVERLRVETPGYVFGVEVAGGRAVATTREGRLAVYGMDATQGLRSSAVVSAPLTPLRVGERLALMGQEPSMEGGGQGLVALLDAEGKVAQEWRVGVMPVGVVPWDGLWWVVDRLAPGGVGLLGVEPASGEVVERLETGEGGVLIGAGRVGERLVAWAMDPQGEGGWVVVASKGPQGRRVRREAVGQRVMKVVPGRGAGEGVMYGLTSGGTEVLVLDAATGAALGVVPTGAVVSEVVISEDGRTMWALSAQGSLARLRLGEGGQGGEEEARVKLGPGSSQMVLWVPPAALVEGTEDADRGDSGAAGAAVWLLDRHARALRWLDPQTLEERGRVALVGTVGRMQVDAARGDVVVSLPELEQVVWVAVEKALE